MAKSQSHAKANKKPTVRYRELIKHTNLVLDDYSTE